ncbi:unnamed protein product [Ostreobium quekettii]|uniref:RAP domain-containing protein n=1 Tax=Ostreobium quekettii TaxID=121088 RepID=A0A8S1IVE1_9CHLO|nr:unnamed protein product [Ostreobium quekettii]|eukprot:evm.model.scf_93.3 EVM.evm.TU.scf_93.3   scf_93:54328-58240(-)
MPPVVTSLEAFSSSGLWGSLLRGASRLWPIAAVVDEASRLMCLAARGVGAPDGCAPAGPPGSAAEDKGAAKAPAASRRVWDSYRNFSTQSPLPPDTAYGHPAELGMDKVELNWRIVSLASKTLHEIRARPGDDVALLDLMVVDFQGLLLAHRHTVSGVNVATMVHRMGRICSKEHLKRRAMEAHSGFLGRLLSLVYLKSTELRSQNISNVVWGLGKLGARLRGLPEMASLDMVLQELSSRAADQINDFRPQNLSNLVTGLAHLEDSHSQKLLAVIARATKPQIDSFKNQEIVNLLWGLSKLGYLDVEGLFPTAIDSVRGRLATLKPQELSSFLWALAAMGHTECADVVTEVLQQIVPEDGARPLGPQALSCLMWSASAMKFRPQDKEVRELLGQASSSLENFTPQNVFMCLYAAAEFHCNIPAFAQAAKAYFMKHWRRLSPQDIMNCIHSLMVLDDLDLRTLLQAVNYAEMWPGHLNERDKRQLYQCILHFRLFYPEVSTERLMSQRLEEECRMLWEGRQKTSPVPRFVLDALVVLEHAGNVCSSRQVVAGVVNTSTVQLPNGRRFAVEGIYIPRGFKNTGALNGRYLWKERVLERLGWPVARLHMEAWSELTSQNDKLRFLGEIMVAAVQRMARNARNLGRGAGSGERGHGRTNS